jgi:hypothetical protein
MIRRLGDPASHVRGKAAVLTPTRAEAPRAHAARHASTHDLPPAGELFAPEQLVDLARGDADACARFDVGAMLDQSPEAMLELEIMASFDDELEPARRSPGYAQRVEMAVDGALASLDD